MASDAHRGSQLKPGRAHTNPVRDPLACLACLLTNGFNFTRQAKRGCVFVLVNLSRPTI